MNLNKHFDLSVEAGFTTDNVRDIYEGGVPSSITLDSQMSVVWRPLHERFKGKFHPADWYSHCPNTSIAYLRANGTNIPEEGRIVARTIIYHDKKGNPIEYGPTYSGDGIFHYWMDSLMRDMGLRHYNKESNWIVTKPFTVQGFKMNDKKNPWVVPFPFLDVLDGPSYSVDMEHGLFTFGSRYMLRDMGLRYFKTQSYGPSHYGVLSSSMKDGLPTDNQWMAKFNRQ